MSDDCNRCHGYVACSSAYDLYRGCDDDACSSAHDLYHGYDDDFLRCYEGDFSFITHESHSRRAFPVSPLALVVHHYLSVFIIYS